jgi:hypothetical protein
MALQRVEREPPLSLWPRRRIIDARPRQHGYLLSLFDFRFVDLVTPKLIRGLYAVVVVWTAILTFLWMWTGLALPAWLGWGTQFLLVVGTPLAALVWLSVFRIFLEYIVVHFALREEMRAVRINLERMNGLPSVPALGPPGPWLAPPPERARGAE